MQGTNLIMLALLLGKRFGPYAGIIVYVDNVAKAHVKLLSPSVSGNQSYILGKSSR